MSDRTWEQHAREDLAPKVASSAYVMTLTPGGEIDPQLALETGYAVLLNKPMVVVSWPGRSVPDGLRRYAHRVIELTAPLGTDAGQQELMARLAEWHKDPELAPLTIAQRRDAKAIRDELTRRVRHYTEEV